MFTVTKIQAVITRYDAFTQMDTGNKIVVGKPIYLIQKAMIKVNANPIKCNTVLKKERVSFLYFGFDCTA